MISMYTANLIRSTGMTGGTTDVAIFLAQACRGHFDNTWKMVVIFCQLVAFWLGGWVSFYATLRWTSLALLVSAIVYVAIGVSLIAFVGLFKFGAIGSVGL